VTRTMAENVSPIARWRWRSIRPLQCVLKRYELAWIYRLHRGAKTNGWWAVDQLMCGCTWAGASVRDKSVWWPG
jgi:uncharacterized membrane protein